MGLTTNQIIKLLQIKGVGNASAFKLYNLALQNSVESDFDLLDFILDCLGKKLVRIRNEYTKTGILQDLKKGEQIIEKSEQAGIKILSHFDREFPSMLKNIPEKPILLNFKGNYRMLNEKSGIAIIGTREPTKEGKLSGEYFGEYFGKSGYNVVSGLAKGCDTAAHEGCLKGMGVTTAIVAHGLHTIYPKENKELSERILANGGILLSEYFIGTASIPTHFVERDRLQAGLSIATIVIQTDIKGGTMHAVNATLKDKKPLAAVQYRPDVFSDKIQGNEMLIRESKAYVLTSKSVGDFAKLLSNKLLSMSNAEKNTDTAIIPSISSESITIKSIPTESIPTVVIPSISSDSITVKIIPTESIPTVKIPSISSESITVKSTPTMNFRNRGKKRKGQKKKTDNYSLDI